MKKTLFKIHKVIIASKKLQLIITEYVKYKNYKPDLTM